MRVMVAVLAAAGALAACGGRSSRSGGPASETWSAPAILGSVPADSPYVVVMLEPAPPEVRDAMFITADRKLAEALRAMEQLPPAFDRRTLSPYERALFAIFDELRGKDLKRWGQELGFDPSGRFALYGLSVWPVLRVAVADAPRLRGAVQRVIAASGVAVPERTLGGRSYWSVGNDKVTLIAAVFDREAVAAIVPTQAAARATPFVLGIEQPARSLRDGGDLRQVVRRHRLLPHMVGYVDARAVANILTGRVRHGTAELDRPFQAALGPISRNCVGAIDRVVDIAPRMVFGYRQLDTRAMHAALIVEMPAAITAALARLRVPVPEVTRGLPAGRPLLHVGAAIRLDELLPLLRRATKHIQDHPFRCDWFAPLESAAAELGAVLQRPLPAPLFGLRGFSLTIDDYQRPLAVRGHALIAGTHANDLLGLVLQSLAPGLPIAPDGNPVALPVQQFGLPPGFTAHAAAQVHQAAVAVGPDSLAATRRALKATAPAHSPLATITMDMARITALGLMDEQEQEIGTAAFQLEVIDGGLSVEMVATFQRP